MALDYRRETQQKNDKLIKNLLANLPEEITSFVRVNEVSKSDNTLLSYVRDISQFLNYVKENTPLLSDVDIADIDDTFWSSLETTHIKEYERFLGKVDNLSNTSIKRRLSSLATLYKYFNAYRNINHNPLRDYAYPKAETKEIVYLTSEQTKSLLEGILSNSKKLIKQKTGKFTKDGEPIYEQIPVELTPEEAIQKEKNVQRDFAIVILFLGTGLRISELVGIDISDIDFENNYVTVVRKGKQMSLEKVYFGKEVSEALKSYLYGLDVPDSLIQRLPEDVVRFCYNNAFKINVVDLATSTFSNQSESFKLDIEQLCFIIRNAGRSNYNPKRGEDALFLSSRGKRLSTRSVELIIKEKVLTYLPDIKNKEFITPHKLRSTAATRLLSQTEDILLVSKQLGHASPVVTAKHYAQLQEEKEKTRLANLDITEW